MKSETTDKFLYIVTKKCVLEELSSLKFGFSPILKDIQHQEITKQGGTPEEKNVGNLPVEYFRHPSYMKRAIQRAPVTFCTHEKITKISGVEFCEGSICPREPNHEQVGE